MKKIVKLMSIYMLFIIASSFQYNYSVNMWSKTRKLNSNDFQGIVTNAKPYEKINVYNDSVIVWSKTRKLTWNDFQGKITNDNPYDVINVYKEGEEDAARSRLAIALYYQCDGSKADHIVRAEFEKNNSWYYPKYKTESVLSHEQLHFDITEIYARKLRMKLLSLKNQCDKLSVGTVYQANETAFIEFVKQYDIETSHGVNKQKQIEWETKILNLLSASDE